MVELDRLEPLAGSSCSQACWIYLKLAAHWSLSQKRKRRRMGGALLNQGRLVDAGETACRNEADDDDHDEPHLATTNTATTGRRRRRARRGRAPRRPTSPLLFHSRLPLIISLLLKLSLLFLLVSDLPPSSLCLSRERQAGFGFAEDANESQQVRSRKSLMLPIMEQTGSIFGSLLGGGGGGGNNNNNGNSAAQQQQQLLIQQQQAADLHQSYKNGQTSDKVTLPGDILLGGLFPIHMKGKRRCEHRRSLF